MTINCPKCVSHSGGIFAGAENVMMSELDDRFICDNCGCIVLKIKERHIKK